MFWGYYNLTSSALTERRTLNVISNNFANVSTPGYKSEQLVPTTFDQVLVASSTDKMMSNKFEVGTINKVVAPDRNYTDFTQGGFDMTTSNLDFALTGPGFFAIQTDDGIVYTRNGSFSLDAEGYLVKQGVGRVLGDGGEIFLGTDNISVDASGNIINNLVGVNVATLRIDDFADYDADLIKGSGDTYTAVNGPIATDTTVMQKALETSNVDIVSEMAKMMDSQRSFQASAQIMTMYDKLITKIVTEIGSL